MEFTIDDHGNPVFKEVFNPIVIDTPAGKFGICQRDGTIEVALNGKTVFAAIWEPEPEEVWVDCDGPHRYKQRGHTTYIEHAVVQVKHLVTRQPPKSEPEPKEEKVWIEIHEPVRLLFDNGDISELTKMSCTKFQRLVPRQEADSGEDSMPLCVCSHPHKSHYFGDSTMRTPCRIDGCSCGQYAREVVDAQ